MPQQILVVGSVNADIYINVERLPRVGETMKGEKGSGLVLPGGKGANQAVAASKLGGQTQTTSFVGVFGGDSHAGMLRQTLNNYGVNTKLCLETTEPSGQAYIILQGGGDNSIVLVNGANHEWPNALPPSLTQAIKASSAVMLQREIPPRVNLMVAQCAKQHGVAVIMDAGGAGDQIDPRLLECLFILAPNEIELSDATGMPTKTREEIITAARALQGKGVQNVLVTLGGDGSIFLDPNGNLTEQSIFKAEKVVDTTGAGDCFRGAFTAKFLEQGKVDEALRFAAKAAAICVSRKGAMTGVPTRSEVDRALGEITSKL